MPGLSSRRYGAGKPTAKAANVPSSTGAIYTIARLLGTSSTLGLISGTNGNLTLSGATISATAAIASGVSQVAVVRESSGQIAVEYPITLTGAVTVPAAPTITLDVGNGQITINKTDGATGGSPITGYVLRSGASAGSLSVVTPAPTSFPYTDTGLTNDVARYYTLAAINAVGEGPQSAVGSATPTAAPTSTFAMTQLAQPDKVYQRSTRTGGAPGKGTGSIPVPISGASAGTVSARIRAEDGVTILQAEFPIGTIANGATSVLVSGVEARLARFYVDLKDSTGWKNGTTLVMMGGRTTPGGQSLAVDMFSRQHGTENTITSLGITPSPYGRCFANFTDINGNFSGVGATAPASLTWQAPATGGTYDSPFAAEFLNRKIALEGVPWALVGCATGGAALRYFATDANGNARLQQVLAAADGAWEEQIWYQGHSDALYQVSSNAYAAGLAAVTAAAFANNSFPGAVRKSIGALPFVTGENFGTARVMNMVRTGGKAFATANGWTYLDASDVALVGGGDQAHVSAAGNVTFARNAVRTLSATGNVGPIVTAAARSGTTLTLTIANQGTALVGSGSWWERFKVFNSGSTRSRWTVSGGAIVNATQVTLTLSTDPGVGQALDVYGNWTLDTPANLTADMLRDNRDPEGIGYGRAITPNTTPVTAAAPTPGGATNAPPTGVIAPFSAFDLSMTNTPTYGAELLAGFGTVLNGGRGSIGGPSVPLLCNVGMTVEGFFQCSALPSSIEGLFATGSGGGNRIMDLFLYNSGLLQVGDSTGNQTNGPTIAINKLYYIAIQCGPSGTKIVVRNVTDGVNLSSGTETTAWANTPTSCNYNFRSINNGGLPLTNGSLFHWSVWEGERWAGSTVTAPSSPLVGNEANLLALWRFNGNGADVVKAER